MARSVGAMASDPAAGDVLGAFSPAVRDIFASFDFHTQVDRLSKANLLYLVSEKVANIDQVAHASKLKCSILVCDRFQAEM